MVIAVLFQRISHMLSTCWYITSHRILSCCLNPFCLHYSIDLTQDKVGIVNTSKPAGGDSPPTKEPPMGKTQVQQESPHKQKKGQT